MKMEMVGVVVKQVKRERKREGDKWDDEARVTRLEVPVEKLESLSRRDHMRGGWWYSLSRERRRRPRRNCKKRRSQKPQN